MEKLPRVCYPVQTHLFITRLSAGEEWDSDESSASGSEILSVLECVCLLLLLFSVREVIKPLSISSVCRPEVFVPFIIDLIVV